DLGAGCFQLLLDVLGLGLGSAFLDGLRCRLDKRLGFAQAQAGDGTDFLDDVDLVLTEGGEDNVEFSLFFGSGSRSTTTGGSNGDRSGSRDAPLLFQHLRKLGSLEDGQCRQVVYDLGEISHFCFTLSLISFSSNRGGPEGPDCMPMLRCPCPRKRRGPVRSVHPVPARQMRSASRAA